MASVSPLPTYAPTPGLRGVVIVRQNDPYGVYMDRSSGRPILVYIFKVNKWIEYR